MAAWTIRSHPSLYNYLRDYDAGIGRYIESDPSGIRASLNLYAYASQDPIGSLDPSGLIRMYGNWCGPDWTGGNKKTWSEMTLHDRGNAKKPIDPLDDACRSHDICYAGCQSEFPCNPAKRAPCFRMCDHDLTNRAYGIGGYSGRVIGVGIDRPGERVPGPNDPRCGDCVLNRDKKWNELQ